MDVERNSINEVINYYSDRHGVPRIFSHAIAHIESRHRQNVDGMPLTSSAGAIGVMQLMPNTARGLGVNPYDFRQNIEGGIRYFAQRLRLSNGDVPTAIAMYYAGIGNVQRRGALEWTGVQTYIRRFNEFVQKNQGGEFLQAMPILPVMPIIPIVPIVPGQSPPIPPIEWEKPLDVNVIILMLVVVVVVYLVFVA